MQNNTKSKSKEKRKLNHDMKRKEQLVEQTPYYPSAPLKRNSCMQYERQELIDHNHGS
jgi:hypothetical protein